MADGVVLLVGVSGLLFALVVLGAAAQILGDAGLRVFYWPRLDHGYEVQYATRLASLPWYLLLYLAAVNGLAIMLFAHDVLGRPSRGYGFWLALCFVPIVMVHLVDYRRSRAAALLTFLLVAGVVGWLAWLNRSPFPVVIAAPLLLWSFNGVRATFADRAFG
jgi:hypothetical protein